MFLRYVIHRFTFTQYSDIIFSVQFRFIRFCTHFGVSRVVCGAHLGLLAPWARGCFRKECGSMAAPCVNRFPWTHPTTPSMRLARLQVSFFSVLYHPTGNRTQLTSFGSAYSTNCITSSSIFFGLTFLTVDYTRRLTTSRTLAALTPVSCQRRFPANCAVHELSLILSFLGLFVYLLSSIIVQPKWLTPCHQHEVAHIFQDKIFFSG